MAKKRDNQKSVYTDPDVQEAWDKFIERYPMISFSNVVNVALREYFEESKNGVDANLKPFTKLSALGAGKSR